MLCICVRKSKCRNILKKSLSFDILWSKTGTFHAVFWNFCIFPIFNFCRSKSGLGLFYAFLTKNWHKNMCQTTKPEIFSLTFLNIVTWMTLILNMFTESLGWYLVCPWNDPCCFIYFLPFDTVVVFDKTR